MQTPPNATQNLNANTMVSSKDTYKIDYFITGLKTYAYMKASATVTKTVHNEFKNVLQAFGCSKGAF